MDISAVVTARFRPARKVFFSVEGPTPPTKDPPGKTRVAVSATAKINRKDFGLTWNAALETGGIVWRGSRKPAVW